MRDPELLRAAVEEAAALAAKLYRSDFATWAKKPGDLVTDADYAVDALLKERLLGARPDHGWLSEETADGSDRLARRRVWIVDPIDGTRDFVRGRHGWAVSAALVEDGEPVAAALAAPEQGRLYLAERGAGATLNGEPLRVQPAAALAGARCPADPGWARAGAVRLTPVPKPNALALRLAMLAAGEADVFLVTGVVREWDIAAAALIAAEAGAAVTDTAGAPLRFNQPRPAFRGLAAAGPTIHAELVRASAG